MDPLHAVAGNLFTRHANFNSTEKQVVGMANSIFVSFESEEGFEGQCDNPYSIKVEFQIFSLF